MKYALSKQNIFFDPDSISRYTPAGAPAFGKYPYQNQEATIINSTVIEAYPAWHIYVFLFHVWYAFLEYLIHCANSY